MFVPNATVHLHCQFAPLSKQEYVLNTLHWTTRQFISKGFDGLRVSTPSNVTEFGNVLI